MILPWAVMAISNFSTRSLQYIDIQIKRVVSSFESTLFPSQLKERFYIEKRKSKIQKGADFFKEMKMAVFMLNGKMIYLNHCYIASVCIYFSGLKIWKQFMP